MSCLPLYENETDYTKSSSRVVIENNKIYQVTEVWKQLSSHEQMDKVIEVLTLEKSFLIDMDRAGILKLINPVEPETLYWINSINGSIYKETKKLVGHLNV